MVGFGRGNAYKKHSIYKEIKKLQQKGCPTYKTWNAGTSEPLGYDSAGELEESPRTSPKKRSADPKSTSYVQSKKHQSEHHGEPASNQQTLDSFLKRTDKKLVKIDNDNCETTKYTLGRLSTIDNSIADSHTKLDGLKKTAVDFDVKLDDIKTTQLKVADGIFNGFQILDESLDETHDKLDTIADKQKGFSKLTTSRDHYQQMAFKLRGQLGAKAVQENKPLHRELANRQDEIDNLTYRLAVKEKAVERQGRRIDELKAELQADRKDRDERAEADRKDREERDKRVEASQKEIKQMLVKLLSKD